MARGVQRRTRTIREGLLEKGAQKWRAQIVPPRLEFGFEIHGARLDHERSRFARLLSYGGPEGFEKRNRQYWASSKRAEMAVEP